MNLSADALISSGMYAFTEPQRRAWRQLFERFFELAGLAPGTVSISFEHDPALLSAPGLWFGHTCGYPLMTRLKDHVTPFCVPLFDAPGTEGRLYCSRFIVPEASDILCIADSRARVCAINNPDSNSGMNVLRYAVAELAEGEAFFDRVMVTGGHLHSVEAVASGQASIAAIDCVSYQLVADARPELIERVRVISDSVRTFGLPFVMPRAHISGTDTGELTGLLGEALASSPASVAATLHLTGFAEVLLDDYRDIVAAEQYAVERGYPELI